MCHEYLTTHIAYWILLIGQKFIGVNGGFHQNLPKLMVSIRYWKYNVSISNLALIYVVTWVVSFEICRPTNHLTYSCSGVTVGWWVEKLTTARQKWPLNACLMMMSLVPNSIKLRYSWPMWTFESSTFPNSTSPYPVVINERVTDTGDTPPFALISLLYSGVNLLWLILINLYSL